MLSLLLAGCASQGPSPEVAGDPRSNTATADGEVLARNDRLLIYRTAAGDTLESIAARFLADPRKGWKIADFNQVGRVAAGQILVVPLAELSPTGVQGEHFQTVPILCYHRFGAAKGKMIVSPESFAEQLEWLARNDYRVIRLADLAEFLAGRAALPERAVVITIDDGYKTVYQHAFPLLRKYRFPATVFLYTDFVGAGDALTWKQMREMTDSGLIEIQAHSKSHANLIERRRGESDADYAARIDTELAEPRAVIQNNLPQSVKHFAYPYGDANEVVLAALGRHAYSLGLTVNPGGNGFFAQPGMLRRTMIYGDHNLEAFKARLQTRRPVAQ